MGISYILITIIIVIQGSRRYKKNSLLENVSYHGINIIFEETFWLITYYNISFSDPAVHSVSGAESIYKNGLIFFLPTYL